MKKKVLLVILSVIILVAAVVTPTFAMYNSNFDVGGSNIVSKTYMLDKVNNVSTDVKLDEGNKYTWGYFIDGSGADLDMSLTVRHEKLSDVNVSLYSVVGSAMTLVPYDAELDIYLDRNAVTATNTKKLYILEFTAATSSVNLMGVALTIVGKQPTSEPGNEIPVGDGENEVDRLNIVDNLSGTSGADFGKYQFVPHNKNVIRTEILLGSKHTHSAVTSVTGGNNVLKAKCDEIAPADLHKYTAVIYVPAEYILKDIAVNNVSASVEMLDINVGNITLKGIYANTSKDILGNVVLDNLAVSTMFVKSVTGTTLIKYSNIGDVEITDTNGALTIEGAKFMNNVTIKNVNYTVLSNTTIGTKGTTAASLLLQKASTSVMFSNFTIYGDMKIQQISSGALTLSNLEANNIDIKKLGAHLILGNITWHGVFKIDNEVQPK